MKKSNLLANKRKDILKELEKQKRKFVELKRILKLESNLLSYNLKLLIKENLIEKNNFYYSLTQKAKYLMPYFKNINELNSIPLPCVATIIKKDKKILIRKRKGEPGKGKEIFVGGKILLGESIFDACKRHTKEKTGIDIKDLKLICINNYFSKNKNNFLHFIVFFVKAKPARKTKPINSEYKSPEKIKRKMYPDNKFIIKNMLNNRNVKIITSIYNEEKDRFNVVNVS